METVNLYTNNFFLGQQLKSAIKKIAYTGKTAGPESVFLSLTEGLKQLSQGYVVNKQIRGTLQTACVLSDFKTLTWAVKQKKKGLIKNIIAGPNIAILPSGTGEVLGDREINKVIVPSLWVKNIYVMVKPELKDKIFVWPAGVALPNFPSEPKVYDFIIYNKLPKNNLAARIKSHLDALKLTYKEVIYGKFNQDDYFKLLGEAKFLIYLSQSESQGLAMFEAWARNVSVLAFEPGYFEYQGIYTEGKIAAPYMATQAGGTFKDFNNFKGILENFIGGSYDPYTYIQNNFTRKLCAQKYLEIVPE